MLYQFIVFLRLLFCPSFHVTEFYLFEFWISKNSNFKCHFETLNDFRWKCHKHKSCKTYQDLQLLFWLFLHPSRKTTFEFLKFEFQFFQTTSDGETIKMKAINLEKLWNFVVHNFWIWDHLVKENYVWIFKNLKFEFFKRPRMDKQQKLKL